MTAAEATDRKSCIWNCRSRLRAIAPAAAGDAELGWDVLPWLLHFVLMAVAAWVHCSDFSSSDSPRKQQHRASSEVLLQTEIIQADLAGLIPCVNTNIGLLLVPPASSCRSSERAHPWLVLPLIHLHRFQLFPFFPWPFGAAILTWTGWLELWGHLHFWVFFQLVFNHHQDVLLLVQIPEPCVVQERLQFDKNILQGSQDQFGVPAAVHNGYGEETIKKAVHIPSSPPLMLV